jgi:hypothetical protein
MRRNAITVDNDAAAADFRACCDKMTRLQGRENQEPIRSRQMLRQAWAINLGH